MATNGLSNRHWMYVARHLAGDFFLFVAAFLGGTYIRFHDNPDWMHSFWLYLPAILSGALLFACLVYIFGLYAPLRMEHAKGSDLVAWRSVCYSRYPSWWPSGMLTGHLESVAASCFTRRRGLGF